LLTNKFFSIRIIVIGKRQVPPRGLQRARAAEIRAVSKENGKTTFYNP